MIKVWRKPVPQNWRSSKFLTFQSFPISHCAKHNKKRKWLVCVLTTFHPMIRNRPGKPFFVISKCPETSSVTQTHVINKIVHFLFQTIKFSIVGNILFVFQRSDAQVIGHINFYEHRSFMGKWDLLLWVSVCLFFYFNFKFELFSDVNPLVK